MKNKINCIIVEDEVQSLNAFINIIKLYDLNLEVLGTAGNIEDAYKLILLKKPELIFLDIELTDGSGFDLLSKFKNPEFKTIFVTAYSHYSIKAIRNMAFDYLLKPINIEELAQSLENFEEYKLKQNKPLEFTANLIPIPSVQSIEFINKANIICCEANDNYTNLYLSDGSKKISSKTLKEYEAILVESKFFRCHRSYIVNIDYVTKFIRGKRGEIELQNGMKIDLAENKKQEFLANFNIKNTE